MIQLIKSAFKHRYALRSQFIVSIKTTVAATKLGPLWWILDPLLLMCIYFFIIKVVFNRGGPDYHLFALCGIVSWQSFSRSVSTCANSLRRNASLIKQTALPMQLYILIPPFVQSFFYLIGLCIIAIWNNDVFGMHSFSLFLLLLPIIFIPFGLGLFLSILEVHFPDTGKLIVYLLRIGFYMSPVLYPAERIYQLENVPALAKTLYSVNPMVHVICAVREVLLSGQIFNLQKYTILLFVTLIIVEAGLLFFRRFSSGIPKAL